MPLSCIITAGHQIFAGKGNGAFGIVESSGKPFDEAVEARRLANDIMAHQLKWYGLDALTDDDTRSLAQVINWQVNTVNECFVCLDIHFNAAASKLATGTEVYIAKNYTEAELELAGRLAQITSEVLGINRRKGKLLTHGVKLENESQHSGLGILNKPNKAINLLWEVCFITNEKDVKAYRAHYWKLVKEVSDLIGNYRRNN
jgi:N-acetylmuramoyl-L-alanine amidase